MVDEKVNSRAYVTEVTVRSLGAKLVTCEYPSGELRLRPYAALTRGR